MALPRNTVFITFLFALTGCPVGPHVNDTTAALTAGISYRYVPVGCGDAWTVPANGGKTPYSYSILSGPGSVNSTTGVYTSIGLSTAPTVIQIKDAIGATATTEVYNVWTANGAVNAIAQDASSNLYLGGSFTEVCMYPGAYGAKIDSTAGEPNYGFDLVKNGGFNGPIYAWVELSDGTVIAGGNFTMFNGNAANYIVKIDTNGQMDTTFNSGTGFNSPVLALAMDSGGQIYAGGAFNQYNGNTANGLAKIDPTAGTLETIFNSGGTGFNGTVESIAADKSGHVYVGGAFSQYDGSTVGGLAALEQTNGLLLSTFNPGGTGFNGTVYAVAVDPTGNVYVGGNFTQYDGGTANHIAKLVAGTGNLDNGFDSGGTGFNGIVYAIDYDSAGVFVGGSFSQCEGGTANNIALLNSLDGTLSTTFDAGGAGFNNTVTSLTSISDGNLYVGGKFTQYSSANAYYIAKLSTSTGTLDNTFGLNNPPNAIVDAIMEDASNNIFVGGNFTGFGGVMQNSISKFNPTTGLDTTFYPSTNSGFNGTVNALALDGLGDIFVGGAFSQYNGSSAAKIAKLNTTNGTLNATFDSGGTGFNNTVNTLALDGSGNIFIGGAFTTYQGGTANGIAKMDTTNGTLNTTFDSGGTGFNNTVNTLALDGSGNIFIGGAFTTYRASTANGIAKMDTTNGTLNSTFNPSGTGFSGGQVYTLLLDGTGSNLYVGGAFTSYRSSTTRSIAKMDTTNGTLNTTFNAIGSGFGSTASAGTVSSLLLDGTGYIYVGGTFSSYQNAFAGNLVHIGD